MDTERRFALNHERCFVCGKKNPHSLGVNFVSADGTTCGTFTTREGMESLGGITHGGILTSLMDASMARWLYDRDILAITAVLEAHFRQPVPPGQHLHLVAKRRSSRGRRHYMECRIFNEDRHEVAFSEAVFCQLKK